jgi:putative transposase
MIQLALIVLSYLRAFFRSRHDLGLEILALRQQLAVFRRRHPQPHLKRRDRLFWVALQSLWARWSDALIIVKPETVVGWHRAGFRLYWRFRSRFPRLGRPRIAANVHEMVKRMAKENPTWGAPQIHGELLKLGIRISERTVSRHLEHRTPGSDESRRKWLAFLKNHREAIAAIDFFTVPTLTFGVLYCFFVIEHHRRKILHFNVTAHPRADWICQQLREAFPIPSSYKYVIMDRDAKFSGDVLAFLKSSGIQPVCTSFRSPWQNGTAERWVGTARRCCFDHVIAINEKHVRRLAGEFISYYSHASLCPPRYVIDKSRTPCWPAANSGAFLTARVLFLRIRSTSCAAPGVSRAPRLRIQGPSGSGCSPSISPRSIAKRRVAPLTPNLSAAWVRFSQPSVSRRSSS